MRDSCPRCGKKIEDEEEAPYCSRTCFNAAAWERGVLTWGKRLFLDLCINFNKSPWAQKQGVAEWYLQLEKEMGELRDAYLKGHPGKIEDELGDVFWCAISLALALQKESLIHLPSVLSGALRKLHVRKPWLFDGSRVPENAEEEERMYEEAKSATKPRTGSNFARLSFETEEKLHSFLDHHPTLREISYSYGKQEDGTWLLVF